MWNDSLFEIKPLIRKFIWKSKVYLTYYFKFYLKKYLIKSTIRKCAFYLFLIVLILFVGKFFEWLFNVSILSLLIENIDLGKLFEFAAEASIVVAATTVIFRSFMKSFAQASSQFISVLGRNAPAGGPESTTNDGPKPPILPTEKKRTQDELKDLCKIHFNPDVHNNSPDNELFDKFLKLSALMSTLRSPGVADEVRRMEQSIIFDEINRKKLRIILETISDERLDKVFKGQDNIVISNIKSFRTSLNKGLYQDIKLRKQIINRWCRINIELKKENF